MPILIAGGAGYIGLAPIPKLLGYDIDVADLFWFGNQLPAEVGLVNRDIFDLQVNDHATAEGECSWYEFAKHF